MRNSTGTACFPASWRGAACRCSRCAMLQRVVWAYFTYSVCKDSISSRSPAHLFLLLPPLLFYTLPTQYSRIGSPQPCHYRIILEILAPTPFSSYTRSRDPGSPCHPRKRLPDHTLIPLCHGSQRISRRPARLPPRALLRSNGHLPQLVRRLLRRSDAAHRIRVCPPRRRPPRALPSPSGHRYADRAAPEPPVPRRGPPRPRALARRGARPV